MGLGEVATCLKCSRCGRLAEAGGVPPSSIHSSLSPLLEVPHSCKMTTMPPALCGELRTCTRQNKESWLVKGWANHDVSTPSNRHVTWFRPIPSEMTSWKGGGCVLKRASYRGWVFFCLWKLLTHVVTILDCEGIWSQSSTCWEQWREMQNLGLWCYHRDNTAGLTNPELLYPWNSCYIG